eukprot:snap_masked-scaffold_10-processed-gene-5.16-mRNA-1 protein AED:0.37 eAED:0.37 QI:0/0/0/0.33/1/1/3/0/439
MNFIKGIQTKINISLAKLNKSKSHKRSGDLESEIFEGTQENRPRKSTEDSLCYDRPRVWKFEPREILVSKVAEAFIRNSGYRRDKFLGGTFCNNKVLINLSKVAAIKETPTLAYNDLQRNLYLCADAAEESRRYANYDYEVMVFLEVLKHEMEITKEFGKSFFLVNTLYSFGNKETDYAVLLMEGCALEILDLSINEKALKSGINSKDKTPGPVSLQYMLYVFSASLLGLNFIHEKGYIHRDIKPDNILIDFNGVPKIADFGLVTRLEDVKVSEGKVRRIGGLGYWAPELRDATKIYDFKIDSYFLAVSCLHFLKGDYPFDFAPRQLSAKAILYQDDYYGYCNKLFKELEDRLKEGVGENFDQEAFCSIFENLIQLEAPKRKNFGELSKEKLLEPWIIFWNSQELFQNDLEKSINEKIFLEALETKDRVKQIVQHVELY